MLLFPNVTKIRHCVSNCLCSDSETKTKVTLRSVPPRNVYNAIQILYRQLQRHVEVIRALRNISADLSTAT
jgi:hypothetical protein